MASETWGSRPSHFMIIPNTQRHPNNTKTDQLAISEVITGLPRPYHNNTRLFEVREAFQRTLLLGFRGHISAYMANKTPPAALPGGAPRNRRRTNYWPWYLHIMYLTSRVPSDTRFQILLCTLYRYEMPVSAISTRCEITKYRRARPARYALDIHKHTPHTSVAQCDKQKKKLSQSGMKSS